MTIGTFLEFLVDKSSTASLTGFSVVVVVVVVVVEVVGVVVVDAGVVVTSSHS